MAQPQEPGTISFKQFLHDCHTLVSQSDWILHEKPNYDPFMKRTYYIQNAGHHLSNSQKLNEDECGELTVPHTNAVRCDCHVIYSHSYCNPVLYFNTFTSDGKMLPVKYIWENLVQSYFHDQVERDPWTFITQAEHPILFIPFNQLHPCHTADYMKPLHELHRPASVDDFNFVKAWLSIVLPVIGLPNA